MILVGTYCLAGVFTCLVVLDEFELRLGREPGQGLGLVTGVLGASLGPWPRLGLTQPLLQVAGHLPHAEQVQQLRAQATRHHLRV